MSFFEDARSKWRARFYPNTPKKPNPYYQELLDAKDKEFLAGFDWAIECFKTFLYNIQDIEAFEDVNFDPANIDFAILFDDSTPFEEYTEQEIDAMSEETKIARILFDEYETWMESDRDMLVTSMLDNTDEETYAENFKKVWGMTQKEADEKDWSEEDGE